MTPSLHECEAPHRDNHMFSVELNCDWCGKMPFNKLLQLGAFESRYLHRLCPSAGSGLTGYLDYVARRCCERVPMVDAATAPRFRLPQPPKLQLRVSPSSAQAQVDHRPGSRQALPHPTSPPCSPLSARALARSCAARRSRTRASRARSASSRTRSARSRSTVRATGVRRPSAAWRTSRSVARARRCRSP